ncbi:hypothetical protein [Nocardia phage NBR1]|uniref:hypothetical protein n=1 Tax=Nocardia phage NBR1 TaxID=1109711 RepID=UPI00023EEDFC|nr:hypothetical protein NoPhNBR1_gp57 [Nocardia phage NBR1]AEV52270.1 hypothetical protein [Nocardia phage NBR1]
MTTAVADAQIGRGDLVRLDNGQTTWKVMATWLDRKRRYANLKSSGGAWRWNVRADRLTVVNRKGAR